MKNSKLTKEEFKNLNLIEKLSYIIFVRPFTLVVTMLLIALVMYIVKSNIVKLYEKQVKELFTLNTIEVIDTDGYDKTDIYVPKEEVVKIQEFKNILFKSEIINNVEYIKDSQIDFILNKISKEKKNIYQYSKYSHDDFKLTIYSVNYVLYNIMTIVYLITSIMMYFPFAIASLATLSILFCLPERMRTYAEKI